jgi:hypothetical protein
MKVFISQPMNGLTDKEIASNRDEAIEEIKRLYSFFDRNNDLEIISTTQQREYEILPKNASRLWWLGRAIQMLEDVDVIYMCRGWKNAKGCKVERYVAIQYDISIHYQGEKSSKKEDKLVED